jgi:uncharacterized protein
MVAMQGFIGRAHELTTLGRLLARVEHGGRTGRPGRAVLMRGRRRVGKSRLTEELIQRAGVPHLFFTASAQRSATADLRLFTEAAQASDLPGAHLFRDQEPHTWDAALQLLAKALPESSPSIVVLDEMPYLIAADPGFEGTLQKLFDRELSRRPVLLVLIGSDLSMMEALNAYGRPFHQRAAEMVVPPLSPADVGHMLDLPAADAFDAYLVSGGLPLILDEWPERATVLEFLRDSVVDSTSALLVSGERALAAEFPDEANARAVLSAIGSGERTYSMIGRSAGDMPPASLTRALHLLTDRRIVDLAYPLSTQPSRQARYLIADPHLRFWLAFLGPYLPEIERGRGDLTLARIRTSWTSWRGHAIEPVIREALRRDPEGLVAPGTKTVGGYWTRSNDPEIDIVCADREPIAKRITAAGSIKWLEDRPFDSHDLGRLLMHRSQLPGADDATTLLAVSRSGSSTSEVRVLRPEDLLASWLPR